MAQTKAEGFVTFRSLDRKYEMTCLLGDGPATPTNGYGGWTEKTRQRRRSFTVWEGAGPVKIDIPIMINYFAEQEGGVAGERDILQLEKMAGLLGGEPPLIEFDSGGAIPHDSSDYQFPIADWVIEDIDWGDCERTQFGNRWRQAAIIKVMQFVEDDKLKNVSAAQRRRGKKNAKKRGSSKRGAKDRIYHAKKGDTLPKIAKKKLGDPKRWHEIAKLNGLRDPDHIKAGQPLRLP